MKKEKLEWKLDIHIEMMHLSVLFHCLSLILLQTGRGHCGKVYMPAVPEGIQL